MYYMTAHLIPSNPHCSPNTGVPILQTKETEALRGWCHYLDYTAGISRIWILICFQILAAPVHALRQHVCCFHRELISPSLPWTLQFCIPLIHEGRKEGLEILEPYLNSIPKSPETLAALSADGSERCLAKEEGGRLGFGRGTGDALQRFSRGRWPPSQLSNRSERLEEGLVSGPVTCPRMNVLAKGILAAWQLQWKVSFSAWGGWGSLSQGLRLQVRVWLRPHAPLSKGEGEPGTFWACTVCGTRTPQSQGGLK